jgi:hypothetical protein
MESFPYDLRKAIALELYPAEICQLALVSRAFGRLCDDESLFHDLYLIEFPKNPDLQLEGGHGDRILPFCLTQSDK